MKQIIKDRKTGKGKSFYENSPDLLTILLGNELYKNDEDMIIDEVLTLFLAGSKTV